MKLYQIINGYKTLESIADNQNFKAKDQWSLYSLRKILRPHVEFNEEQVKKLNEKYREFADENGLLRDKPYIDYIKELNELDNVEIEINIEKIQLPVVDGVDCLKMEALEDFVEFNPE